jgi:tetratricopeptide (TPR) repeat protein
MKLQSLKTKWNPLSSHRCACIAIVASLLAFIVSTETNRAEASPAIHSKVVELAVGPALVGNPTAAYRFFTSSMVNASTSMFDGSVSTEAANEILANARKAAFNNRWTNVADLAGYVASHSPADSWNSSAMAGYAELQLGDADAAYESLLSSIFHAPESAKLRPFIGYWLTQAAVSSGHYSNAEFYAQIVDRSALPVALRSDLSLLLARSKVNQCRSVGDVQAARSALAKFPAYPRAATTRTEIARCLRTLGRPDLAANELEALDQASPWLPVVQSAIAEHAEATGVTVHAYDAMPPTTHLEWIRDIRISRNWELAEAQFQRFAERWKMDQLARSTRNDFWFQRALNAYESANFERAIEFFDAIGERRVGVDPWLVSKYYALALSRVDRQDEALAIVRASCRFNASESCADTVFEFAWDFGKYDAAYEIVESGRLSGLDSMTQGLLAFLREDFTSAEKIFEDIAGRTGGHTNLQARYWRARSLQQLERADEASRLWRAIAEERPFDYYALLSRGWLRSEGDGETDVSPAAIGRSFQLSWNTTEDGADGGADNPLASRELAAIERFASRWSYLFPEAKTALELARIGAVEEARLVLRPAFREIEWRKQTSPENPSSIPWSPYDYRIDNRRSGRSGWYGVSLEGSDEGHASATRSNEQLVTFREEFSVMLADATDAAEAVNDCFMVRQFLPVDGRILGPLDNEDSDATLNWQRFHCRPFASRIRQLSREYGMAPEMLWGLILAESSANPDSISHADAFGLMQVIPRTGTRIALGYGANDFGVHQLLDPRESIKFGGWYLSELMERFRGQEPLALVSYNAGPHQVARWLDWRGENLPGDLFFETIPFSGAQNYAKKILRLAVTYRYLDGQSHTPHLAYGLNSDDADNIYY